MSKLQGLAVELCVCASAECDQKEARGHVTVVSEMLS
jgi:hypothetical protein